MKHIATIVVLLIPAGISIAAQPTLGRPYAIYAPMPEYPPQARASRVKGDGVFYLRVQIRTGIVKDVLVVRSTGSSILDGAAIRALKQWRFKPGREYLSPISIQSPNLKDAHATDDSFVKLPVHFTLGH